MKKKFTYTLLVAVAVMILGFTGNVLVHAAIKETTASKRNKLNNESIQSMRDVFKRRESKEERYRETMLSNSSKTIELLSEIKVLLKLLNEKEE